jgi:hypothetical protein
MQIRKTTVAAIRSRSPRKPGDSARAIRTAMQKQTQATFKTLADWRKHADAHRYYVQFDRTRREYTAHRTPTDHYILGAFMTVVPKITLYGRVIDEGGARGWMRVFH